MNDKNDCSVYAVAFCCSEPTDVSRYWLWACGREHGDGATDFQIREAMRALNHSMRRVQTPCKTIRGFARSRPVGTFLVASDDHVVAVIDGYVCNRPAPEHSDLYRIEKVWKVSQI